MMGDRRVAEWEGKRVGWWESSTMERREGSNMDRRRDKMERMWQPENVERWQDGKAGESEKMEQS